MHRLILDVMKGTFVDHKDRNGLNNRKYNLRPATKGQNVRNCKRPDDNTSGYKGVGFHGYSGRWRAYIGLNGKQKSLGYYDSPEEASDAYDTAAIRYFGEFALTNKELESRKAYA
jgi:hypothetical protein